MTTGWTVALRKPPSERTPGKAVLRLCAGFEGLELAAYPDPASPLGRKLSVLKDWARKNQRPAPTYKDVDDWQSLQGDPWTIAYGHTGPDVQEGMTCTLAQADAWLLEDINEAASIVRAQITVPLAAGEFDALTSLVFNLGYIPKSLKACLNGGVTDKGVQMAPGSYGSAMAQLPRNCRAAGIPLRGLLRRRLAEACVYSDLPWEAACSENIVKLVHTNGVIDTYQTTSLEDTLERARQDVPILRPDVSDVMRAPWPTAVDAPLPETIGSEIPVQLPLPEIEYEDTPAAPLATDAKGTEPAQATQPSVQAPSPISVSESAPAKPSNSTQAPMSKPATGEVAAAPPSRSEVTPSVSAPAPQTGAAAGVKPAPAEPPSKPLPKSLPPIASIPQKPESRWSVPITDAPYRIDPNLGLKPMEETERWQASIAQNGGMLMMRVARYGGFGAGPATVATYIEKDPLFSGAFMAVIGLAGLWVIGHVRKCYGDWKRFHAERKASQAMV